MRGLTFTDERTLSEEARVDLDQLRHARAIALGLHALRGLLHVVRATSYFLSQEWALLLQEAPTGDKQHALDGTLSTQSLPRTDVLP